MINSGLTVDWENLTVSELCSLGCVVTVDGDQRKIVFKKDYVSEMEK